MTTRLDEIRAQRAALAQAKAERDAEAQAQAELETEEQALRDEQALDKAEAEYGPSYVLGEQEPGNCRLAVVKTSMGSIILKRAHHVIFKKFAESGKTSMEEFDKLVSPSVVHPDLGTFHRIVEEQPGILARCGSAVAEMAGVRTRETMGK